MNGSQGDGAAYRRLLTAFSGLGGLLYGADIGIIAAALLYLSKTVDLSLEQTSLVVAAVLGGSMFSSLASGVLADWVGRRKMTIVSGVMFLASIIVIVTSHGFTGLFLGRLLQGMSGGVIAVVVPLYLAECLSANERGRGTALFQFMLTLGILIAAFIGWTYTRGAETAIAQAAGNAALIRAAEDHAWRGMFLTVIYPGILFFLSSLFLSETPRWLFRRGRMTEARAALRRGLSEQETAIAWQEMEDLARAQRSRREPHRRFAVAKEVCGAVCAGLCRAGAHADHGHQFDSQLSRDHSPPGRHDSAPRDSGRCGGEAAELRDDAGGCGAGGPPRATIPAARRHRRRGDRPACRRADLPSY